MKKLKHRKYFSINKIPPSEFNSESNVVVYVVTIEYVKGNIYKCHIEIIKGGDLLTVSSTMVDRYYTRGKISEMIRTRAWEPTDSAMIAAYLLAE